MTKIHPHFWNQLKCVIASVLLLITSNSVFGQFYLQGGASNWFDFEAHSSLVTQLPIVDRESSKVDGNTQFWLGAGYQVNEEWSFEAFYSKLPSTEVNSDLYFFYEERPFLRELILPQTISISVKTNSTTVGVGAVYDFYVNEQLSLIGKAGVAFTQQDSVVGVMFPRFRVQRIFFEDDDDEFDSYDDGFYFDDDGFFDDEASTIDMYFAVGVRLPIQDTRACVTATYQFVNTPESSESGLFVGIRWDL